MSRNILVGIVVVVVLLAGGWWYLNQSSAPATFETNQLPTTQQSTNTPNQTSTQAPDAIFLGDGIKINGFSIKQEKVQAWPSGVEIFKTNEPTYVVSINTRRFSAKHVDLLTDIQSFGEYNKSSSPVIIEGASGTKGYLVSLCEMGCRRAIAFRNPTEKPYSATTYMSLWVGNREMTEAEYKDFFLHNISFLSPTLAPFSN
ncbi:hypothetical protein HYW59_00620 [Candidatus Kaiserbacteria bacterium]|nr:hypothetical protein [Candidatus Kaiserbacteria bacterium]